MRMQKGLSVEKRNYVELLKLIADPVNGSEAARVYVEKKNKEQKALLEEYDKAQNEYWANRKKELAAIKAAREAAKAAANQ